MLSRSVTHQYLSITFETDIFLTAEAQRTQRENEPDKSVIFMYGIRSLPVKIEKVFGTVESIQGDSREMWIKPDRKY